MLLVGLLVFGVAAGLVFAELATPSGLYGVTEYDDAVYFTSALRLTTGALAYRDFVFVQPPGIAVLFAPLAGLAHVIGTREAMALARIVTGVVAGVNTLLVVLLLRHLGPAAALVGGLALVLFPPAFAADHTLMLEPYLVLFCLLAAALAFVGEDSAALGACSPPASPSALPAR